MRLLASRLLLLALALLAVVPATAGAATTPKITSVSPLNLKIGERLTIHGSGFRPGKNRTTVVFKAGGQRAVFVKALSATRTKLVVAVPAKLAPFLKVKAGGPVGTRFQLRVLATRFSKAYTRAGASPTIAPAAGAAADAAPVTAKKPSAASGASGAKASASAPTAAAPGTPSTPSTPPPADCDGDGQADAVDTDDDGDLLLDTVEHAIGTSSCDKDTDGDGMTDGWEYKSALDLNNRSCIVNADYPTPCEAALPSVSPKPYPNPLEGDANTDYDGDALTAHEEFTAWNAKAKADAAWRNLDNLWYSDGLQASVDTSAPNDGCRGILADAEPFHGSTDYPQFDSGPNGAQPDLSDPAYEIYSLDRVGRHGGDGCLDDAERDEDNDFLTNFDETHGGFSSPTWWQQVYSEPAFVVTYATTNWLVADTNRNGVRDGLDDSDHDDFLNVEEVTRGAQSRTAGDKDTGVRSGLWVDPYNPCLPSVDSRTCPPTLRLDLSAWRPFKKSATESDPLPRWPLYPMPNATSAYYGYLPYDPIDLAPDPDGSGPLLPPPATRARPRSGTAPASRTTCRRCTRSRGPTEPPTHRQPHGARPSVAPRVVVGRTRAIERIRGRRPERLDLGQAPKVNTRSLTVSERSDALRSCPPAKPAVT